MKLICAGLSKTGTKSLAKALRHLGLTVYDVEDHLTVHCEAWRAVFLEGQTPDFASMYCNVDAVIGMPTYSFYEEILQAFPEAKVLLSLRENETVWVDSFMREIRTSHKHEASSDSLLDRVLWFLSPTFRRSISEVRKRKHLTNQMRLHLFGTTTSLPIKGTYLFRKRYFEHNQRVRSVIPQDKLLSYTVTQGWGPLCQFLNCEEPNVPFPHENVLGAESTKIRERIFSGNRSTRVIAETAFSLAVLAAFVTIPMFAAVKYGLK